MNAPDHPAAIAAAPARPAARYAKCIDGSWQTWTGKGKRPAWVRAWIDQGGTLAELEAA